MSTTFDAKTTELETVYNNALTEFKSAKAKVDNATDVFNRATVKFDAANISKEGIVDAVNLVYPDPDADNKETDSTIVTPYVSAVAIGYFRSKKAHDGAVDNLWMAIERLETTIAAYNTHVISKHGIAAATVPLPGTIFNGEPHFVFHGSVKGRLIGMPADDKPVHNLYDSDDVCILARNKKGEYGFVTYVNENGVVGPV